MRALLLLLAACAPPDAIDALDERVRALAVGTWSDGDGFLAYLPQNGLAVRFDSRGVRVGSRAPLGLHLAGWGRAGALRASPARPSAGPCLRAPGCVAGVWYADEALTEAWIALPDGLAQRWTVAEAPAGAGPLRFTVALDGARELLAGRRFARFTDAERRRWTVSDLAARDAAGRALPAWIEADPKALHFVVDDRGARYPIEVDPLYSTPAQTLRGGPDGLGSAAAVGDLNADGYADIALGAPAGDDETGRVLVYYGSPRGPSMAPDLVLSGEGAGHRFGEVVAAGDFNGDGAVDLAASSPGFSAANGRVYIFDGGAAGLSGTPSQTMDGSNGDVVGEAMAAGDLDGDGMAELAARVSDRVQIWSGGSGGLTRGLTLQGEPPGDEFGAAITIGERLWVGAPASGADLQGRVYGFDLSDPANPEILEGAEAGGRFGEAIGVGDLDGDGAEDIAARRAGGVDVFDAGGLRTTLSGESADFGAAMVVRGGELWVSDPGAGAGRLVVLASGESAPRLVAAGDHEGERLGAALAAGDLDGDGVEELVAGAPEHRSGAGRAAVVRCAAGCATPSSGAIHSDRFGNGFGVAMAAAGDLNGDGWPDLLAGASDADQGTVYLFAGSGDGLDAEPLSALGQPANTAGFGRAVARAGDVNGDGVGDAVVGAPGDDEHPGRATVFHGTPSGLRDSPASTMLAEDTGDNFGFAVAGAGDLNGDGYDDVLVGAPGTGDGRGSASAYAGGPGGAEEEPFWRTTGRTSGAGYGWAVRGLGPVGGPGVPGIVVASNPSDYRYNGELAIYLSRAGQLAESTAQRITSNRAGTGFGSALDAGDLDGDGFIDLAVGAPIATNATGVIWVYMGSNQLFDTIGTVISAPGPGARYGAAVAVSTHADGSVELILGAPGISRGGEVVTVRGSTLNETGHLRGTNIAPIGEALAAPGDLNGDGLADAVLRVGDDLVVTLGYTDADRDGFASVVDCDDGDAAVYPGAEEQCDGTDSDCDGRTDDGPGDYYFADADQDGWADLTEFISACSAPPGYIAPTEASDCDDSDPLIHPDATEICDNFDNDCDTSIDEDALESQIWHADFDADGYTSATDSVTACDQPDGYRSQSPSPDCDDADPETHPGAVDATGDGRDQNCDGRDRVSGFGGWDTGCGGCAGGSAPLGLGFWALALVRRRGGHAPT